MSEDPQKKEYLALWREEIALKREILTYKRDFLAFMNRDLEHRIKVSGQIQAREEGRVTVALKPQAEPQSGTTPTATGVFGDETAAAIWTARDGSKGVYEYSEGCPRLAKFLSVGNKYSDRSHHYWWYRDYPDSVFRQADRRPT